MSDFMKVRPVGTDGRTDRQTGWREDRQRDVTNLTVAFRNFAKEPKTCTRISLG